MKKCEEAPSKLREFASPPILNSRILLRMEGPAKFARTALKSWEVSVFHVLLHFQKPGPIIVSGLLCSLHASNHWQSYEQCDSQNLISPPPKFSNIFPNGREYCNLAYISWTSQRQCKVLMKNKIHSRYETLSEHPKGQRRLTVYSLHDCMLLDVMTGLRLTTGSDCMQWLDSG